MKIRKTLCGLIGGLALSGLVYAQNVGDKMPDYTKDTVKATEMIGAGELRKKFFKMEWYDNKDGTDAYMVIFGICGGKPNELPFGVFDKQTKNLYLDNAPTDGIIDEIISNVVRRRVAPDMPDCGPEV
jgi:hypothetical protein